MRRLGTQSIWVRLVAAIADVVMLRACLGCASVGHTLGLRCSFGQVAVAWADPPSIDTHTLVVQSNRASGGTTFQMFRESTKHVWWHSTPDYHWPDEPPVLGARQSSGQADYAEPGARALLPPVALRTVCARKKRGRSPPRVPAKPRRRKVRHADGEVANIFEGSSGTRVCKGPDDAAMVVPLLEQAMDIGDSLRVRGRMNRTM